MLVSSSSSPGSSKLRRRLLGLGVASGVLVVAVAGCGDNSESAAGGGNTFAQGGSSSGGSASGGAAGDASAGNGGSSAGGFGGGLNLDAGADASAGSTGDGGLDCAGEVSAAERIPLDMILMLDRSLSMNALAGSQTKWNAVSAALDGFFNDNQSTGIGVGIQYFPANTPCTSDTDCSAGFCYFKVCNNTVPSKLQPCQVDLDCPGATAGSCAPLGGCGSASCVQVGSDCGNGLGSCNAVASSVCVESGVAADDQLCDGAQYATPAVGIAELPANAAVLSASLAAHSPAPLPFGFTPTGPALQGAIDYAKGWATANPTHRVVAVLATDGVPTKCAPSGDSAVAAIAAVGRATAGLETFTIGVFEAGDMSGPEKVQAIADSGGGQAFIVDENGDVAAQFVAALNAIRGEALECEFEIPEPPPGETLDYGKVNVEFGDGGGNTTTLPFVAGASSCDPAAGGWYYDVDPAVATPSKIIVCDTNCDEFKGSVGASVSIRVGCETVVEIPR